jgi:hypothetical protein
LLDAFCVCTHYRGLRPGEDNSHLSEFLSHAEHKSPAGLLVVLSSVAMTGELTDYSDELRQLAEKLRVI